MHERSLAKLTVTGCSVACRFGSTSFTVVTVSVSDGPLGFALVSSAKMHQITWALVLEDLLESGPGWGIIMVRGREVPLKA